ncbi:uncharacterized protein EI97DRAFT_63445 [Westerdykella ornata]|uniref:Uncharacterized protein n=1 Tax=Westerdykella ornata TaxID=318751 RepID=A0A6A6JM63_WESOR|nr:uncharacterized protein EI97DRAFT_63445 [Westerdykella ornata]KAF2276009.1 hypothetical protein EI97DRAFT_63445 [Westerdykella ornata]
MAWARPESYYSPGWDRQKISMQGHQRLPSKVKLSMPHHPRQQWHQPQIPQCPASTSCGSDGDHPPFVPHRWPWTFFGLVVMSLARVDGCLGYARQLSGHCNLARHIPHFSYRSTLTFKKVVRASKFQPTAKEESFAVVRHHVDSAMWLKTLDPFLLSVRHSLRDATCGICM